MRGRKKKQIPHPDEPKAEFGMTARARWHVQSSLVGEREECRAKVPGATFKPSPSRTPFRCVPG